MGKRGKGFTGPLVLVAVVVAICAGGCWDRREINELSFFSSAAFDLEGQERVLTVEYIKPSPAGGGGEGGGRETLPQRQAIIDSEKGATFLEAGRQGALGMPRRAYLAHAAAILIGEEMARYGIKEVLEHIDRIPEFRRTTLILLTRGPARDEVIMAQSGLEKNLGREITGLHKWVQVSGYGFIPNVNHVFYDLSGEAGSTVLPVLELAPQPYPPLLGRGGTAGGTGGATAPKAETLLTARLNGAGLFYRDKLVAWLNAEQTRGWSWVRNKVKNAVLTLSDQNGSLVSLNITDSRAKTEVEYRDGLIRGYIKVKVEGNLLEEQGYQDFTKEEAVKYLEEQAAARIRAEITEALRAAQKAGTDVFGFAGALHRRYPKVWRQVENNWRDEFQRLPVTIVIKAKLRRTGMTGRPLKPGGGS